VYLILTHTHTHSCGKVQHTDQHWLWGGEFRSKVMFSCFMTHVFTFKWFNNGSEREGARERDRGVRERLRERERKRLIKSEGERERERERDVCVCVCVCLCVSVCVHVYIRGNVQRQKKTSNVYKKKLFNFSKLCLLNFLWVKKSVRKNSPKWRSHI